MRILLLCLLVSGAGCRSDVETNRHIQMSRCYRYCATMGYSHANPKDSACFCSKKAKVPNE